MPGKFVAPSPDLAAFTCPSCDTLCTQYKKELHKYEWIGGHRALAQVKGTWFTTCHTCQHVLLWHEGSIAHPRVSAALHPHPDLPESLRTDYEEARRILADSPRGAAALLRYIIDCLTIELRGAKGGSINDRIGWLVKNKGLAPQAQQALDSVRVIGDHAVHPLSLDLNDTPELAAKLFGLVNAIVEDTITRPRAIAAVYSAWPQPQLDAIKKRDDQVS